jgi:hypothetical protein
MSIFNLEVLKGKLTKSIKILPLLKLSKIYVFGTKTFEKQTKITTYMNL